MNKNLEIALNKIYNTEVDIFFIEENESLVCYKSRNHIIENEIPYIDFFEDCIIYINNNSKKYNIVLSKDENNIFINILDYKSKIELNDQCSLRYHCQSIENLKFRCYWLSIS